MCLLVPWDGISDCSPASSSRQANHPLWLYSSLFCSTYFQRLLFKEFHGEMLEVFYAYLSKRKEKKMNNSPKAHTDQYKEWQQLFSEHQSHWAARMPPLLLHNRFLIHGPAVGRIQDWIMSQYTFYPTLFLYVVSSFSIWSQRLSKNTQIFFMSCPCVVTQQRIDQGKHT